MLLIPAIDIRNKKCVRLFKGDFEKETIYSNNPVDVSVKWISEGANPSNENDLSCTMSDGSIVENGWSGPGLGNDWCNDCFCENGILSCTEVWCGCQIDLDNDGVCDDVDECIGKNTLFVGFGTSFLSLSMSSLDGEPSYNVKAASHFVAITLSDLSSSLILFAKHIKE